VEHTPWLRLGAIRAGETGVKRFGLSMTALAALSGGLAISAAAQAQSWDSRSSYSRESREERCDCYDYGARRDSYLQDDRNYGYHSGHQDNRQGYGPPPPAGSSYYAPPGGGQNNMGYFEQYEPGRSAFRPGLILPPYFRGYMVTDNRLARKRGYAWYKVGNEYIRASTSTGEVTSIVTFP
jgi:Ni/Co efflux regulator RcnB